MSAHRLCRLTPRRFPATILRTTVVLGSVWLGAVLVAIGQVAMGCPFCASLKPTLTQRREAASVVVLGEFLDREGKQATFRLHQCLQGRSLLMEVKADGPKEGGERLRVTIDAEFKPGALVLLLGEAKKADGASP